MDDAEAQQLLHDERERVEAALEQHAEAGGASGAALQQAGRDAGQRERLDDELRAIERAEQRLADGTFGASVESGEAIPDARLRLQPTAERTVAEQQRLEG